MRSTSHIGSRAARSLLLLVGGLALVGHGLLGPLHVACDHGGGCAAVPVLAGPAPGVAAADLAGSDAPDDRDRGRDAETDTDRTADCAVCRALQGSPPAPVPDLVVPAPVPTALVAIAPTPRPGVPCPLLRCTRAPPAPDATIA
jgi:hypothetical protein